MKTVLRGLFPSVEITNDDESVSWSSNVSGLSLPLCLVINIDQLALFFGGGRALWHSCIHVPYGLRVHSNQNVAICDAQILTHLATQSKLCCREANWGHVLLIPVVPQTFTVVYQVNIHWLNANIHQRAMFLGALRHCCIPVP